MSLEVDKDGSSKVSLFDTKGNDRIGLYVAPGSPAGITIHDSGRKLIFYHGKEDPPVGREMGCN